MNREAGSVLVLATTFPIKSDHPRHVAVVVIVMFSSTILGPDSLSVPVGAGE